MPTTKKKTTKRAAVTNGQKKSASTKGKAGKEAVGTPDEGNQTDLTAATGEKTAQQGDGGKPFRLTEASKRKLIRDLIATIGTRIQNKKEDVGSIADLTRLLQLEKELGPKRPRNITVVWQKPKDR
jgi:hypothetical protein